MRGALVVFFTLHALSAAAAVGLPLVIGWHDRRRRDVAAAMTPVALVNLSVAVVLGVGVLLFILMVWPRAFVAGATAWFYPLMAVVALLSAAFASLYAYKLADWRPGPWVCAATVAGVGVVFALVSSHRGGAGALVRLAHFLPAALAAAGVAVMVRMAGTEAARGGARLAFFASLIQAATGVLYLYVLPETVEARTLFLPVGSAAGLLFLLGVPAFSGGRVSRLAGWLAAAGMGFTVLAMAALREGFR